MDNPGRSDAGGCGDLSSDDEEQDDPSSSHSQSVEDVLMTFREKWHNELKISTKRSEKSIEDDVNDDLDDYEQKAKSWYLKGAELERAGIFYEAIQCYKRAVQLVPDIEFKINANAFNPNQDKNLDIEDYIYKPENSVEIDEESSDENDAVEEASTKRNILTKIQKKMAKTDLFCIPEYEQRMTHISSLPMEILLYIFKWVVSSDLDLRSLEMCAMVSRGFYLCARDSEIWKLACIRSWGINCGNLTNSYSSWRDMFLERYRVHFNGCYISKTTYIRHGENSFQDQFYKPWHLVAYYRYLRFFPEGLVFMLTTPDDPAQCVGLLKQRIAKSTTILTGHYRLKEDKVIIVVQHQQFNKPQYNKRTGRRKDVLYENAEQTFHLELEIKSHHKLKHIQLIWRHYAVFTRQKNGTESQTSFEIANNRFPPLWFSRVKSYTQEANTPLQ